MANDMSNFENGLKMAKVWLVPSIGPMLLKVDVAALTTTIKLLLSSDNIKVNPRSKKT